jgi:hypothetical protein
MSKVRHQKSENYTEKPNSKGESLTGDSYEIVTITNSHRGTEAQMKNVLSYLLLLPTIMLMVIWLAIGLTALFLRITEAKLESFIDMIVKYNDTTLMQKIAGKK